MATSRTTVSSNSTVTRFGSAISTRLTATPCGSTTSSPVNSMRLGPIWYPLRSTRQTPSRSV
jgi:hypothetical protein